MIIANSSEPAGGASSGALTETAEYGVAPFSNPIFNEPSFYTLTVSGAGLTGTIGPIEVVADPPVQLVVKTEPPVDVTSGGRVPGRS